MANDVKANEVQVLSSEYIQWLTEFIQREKFFDDDPADLAYWDEWSDEEKDKVRAISALIPYIVNYYEANNMEIPRKEAVFRNKAFLINLTDNVTIEIVVWYGIQSVVEVTLAESVRGEVNISNILNLIA